ncbi:alpha-mannosidase 2x-like isoform X2 [Liolophura sinensis]|uniref:alpha-mannosidase 2x-like isoform X2 n=1 Tax=Liolophura sinensis TaxID=3198878 RepID=UPI0031583859
MILDQYRQKAQLYKNDMLLVPLEDDFRYDKPDEWDNQFNNYQRLFDHINGRPELNAKLQFVTLKDFFNAVAQRSQLEPEDDFLPKDYPVLRGDFFTYSDRDDHYWSGYFSSRPFHKSLDRITEYHLRMNTECPMIQCQRRQFCD